MSAIFTFVTLETKPELFFHLAIIFYWAAFSKRQIKAGKISLTMRKNDQRRKKNAKSNIFFLFYDAWVPNLLLLVIDQSSLASKLFQVHWEVDLNRTKNDLLPSRKSKCSVQHKGWKMQKLRLSLSTLFCPKKSLKCTSIRERDFLAFYSNASRYLSNNSMFIRKEKNWNDLHR